MPWLLQLTLARAADDSECISALALRITSLIPNGIHERLSGGKDLKQEQNAISALAQERKCIIHPKSRFYHRTTHGRISLGLTGLPK